MDPQRENSPGDRRDLGAGRGRQRGEQTGTGTEADSGTRRRAQGRAANDGGRRVRATYRWAALRSSRGGGERVKFRGFQRGTATDGEDVGKRGERTIQKTREEKGGMES